MRTFARKTKSKQSTKSARLKALHSASLGSKEEQIAQLQRTIGNQAVQQSVLSKKGELKSGVGSEGHANATVEAVLHSSGKPLDPTTRHFLEPRLQEDFSGVRIHTDSQASESAEAMNAQAYTVGSHIVFGKNHYEPHSPSGAGLLSHELTHVTQSHGQPSALRRKPDGNKLDLQVPDVSTVPEFKPSVDYAWQNENLRDSLFPYRNSAFREFLSKEKGIDLRQEARTGFSADLLSDIGEKILSERQALGAELNSHKQERLQAESDLRNAQKETKKHLADPEVVAQTRQKREWENKQKNLMEKARAQESSIAALESKGDALGVSAQTELEKRREMLTAITDELGRTTELLEQVRSTLDSGTAPFKNIETELKVQIDEHKKHEKILQPKFDRVKGGVNAKTKKANPDAAVKWQLDEYNQMLNGLDHDQLLGLILDRFDADKDFKRYPKQDRYLIIHFSGMRYASANGTYGPPKELVATLKELEIREMFEDPDQKENVEKAAEESAASIESELKSDKTGSPRKAELRNVKKGLVETPAKVRAELFKKNPQFEKLETLESERTQALAQKDDDKAADLSEQIEQLEQGIGDAKLKKLRAVLQSADLNRLKVLRDFRVKEAKEQISNLNDLQALSVLQAMQDQFPAWVWDLIVRRTQLRVNFTDSPKWEDPHPKKLTELQKLKESLKNPRWKKIMDHWPRESTSWNPKYSEKFEIVAETVVCNQLSEHVQYLGGKKISQGIRGAVEWYREEEKKAKLKGAAGSDQPFFVRPTKKEDFVKHAGLFWAHFEKKQPYKENMAHILSGIDFLTENKQVIKDGLIEGEWTYHIDQAGDITRTKGQEDKIETQWYSWQHEATVMKLDDSGNVITFETSTGSRWTTRSLESLIDPAKAPWWKDLHDDTNVFVGYAPQGKNLPNFDKSLEKILPGRNAY